MAEFRTIDSRLPRAPDPAAGGGAVMFALGPVAFEVPASAYARLRRRVEWRWPAPPGPAGTLPASSQAPVPRPSVATK